MEQRHIRYVDPMELRGRMDTLRAEELARIVRALRAAFEAWQRHRRMPRPALVTGQCSAS